MKNIIFKFACAGCLLIFWGCSTFQETAKVIWGSSTRALEKVRPEAEAQTFSCTVEGCFDAVLALTDYRPPEEVDDEEAPPFKFFLKDRVKSLIVVMGIAGDNDSTEVGVFFDYLSDKQVEVQVASLSKRAKMKAAEIIFAHLSEFSSLPAER